MLYAENAYRECSVGQHSVGLNDDIKPLIVGLQRIESACQQPAASHGHVLLRLQRQLSYELCR